MDSEKFVRAVKATCSDTEGGDVIRSLKNPPGRRPSASLLRLSEWFHRFSPADQAMLLEALNDAAERAVFGFLCVLDGVRAIETGSEKGSLEIYYVNVDQRVC